MSLLKSLAEQAQMAEDYNDMNLARLCLTAADEIEQLQKLVADLTQELDYVGGSGWRDETDELLTRAGDAIAKNAS